MNKLFYIVYEVVDTDNVTRYFSEYKTLENGLTSEEYNNLLNDFKSHSEFKSCCVFNVIPIDIFLAPITETNKSNMVIHFKGIDMNNVIISGSLSLGINISKLNSEKYFDMIIDFVKNKANLNEVYIHSVTTLTNKPS